MSRVSGGARLFAVMLAAAVACGAVACGTAESPDASPSGSYPVATAPSSISAIPTVATGGYQLVAAGDPVEARLTGARVRIAALGPDVAVRTGADGAIDHEHADGTLTMRIDVLSGHLAIPASSFLTLDEKQEPIATAATPASVDLASGQGATIRLNARFDAGHTTVTWQPTGKPLITWDFTIELD